MNDGMKINAKKLSALLAKGENEIIEFKRSTGEMKEAMQTLCAFLNSIGGTVLIGVKPDGTVGGQDVSDRTFREIAQATDRFEPPAHVSIDQIKTSKGQNVIALVVEGGQEMRPFAYEGRAYERISSTTRRMPQSKYERLLIERGHAKRRWENLIAEGVKLNDLDRKEILRTRELAIQQNRISPDTSRDPGEILNRLGLRINNGITHAAQVLYGTQFLPNYPQCLLKMGRFRGTEITGEIVDNRQEHMSAFAMVREGMEFLKRTMPLGARFPEGEIFREDRFPVPLDALREILLNAVMHRDYSHYSGNVSIVVFDDRIEIRSYGRLPTGITVEQLAGRHESKPVNPLIAGAFHRTGAVEVWGRGTNRVIAMCKKHGTAVPSFEERQGFLIVTFKAQLVAATGVETRQPKGRKVSEKTSEKVSEKTSEKILATLAATPEATIAELTTKLGVTSRTIERNIQKLIAHGRLKRIGPDKGGHWAVIEFL
ncbi:MAG: putative DNA binding domain-containing protein [Acidobacteria bacterium]|nr:putative DNA binding domain-containing protein [Acidobacteriota bacterium]